LRNKGKGRQQTGIESELLLKVASSSDVLRTKRGA
jgi:hypothetical protein